MYALVRPYIETVLFCAYTFCEKQKPLSARPYIETVLFLRIHSNKRQKYSQEVLNLGPLFRV